jgi:hypothetical protein
MAAMSSHGFSLELPEFGKSCRWEKMAPAFSNQEFSLEYALSQIFSPKQKELFKKKLEGLPLNKTEQEYYSRTVKKKTVALANSELHGMARKLLKR